MWARFRHVPLLVVLLGATGLAMLVPSAHAFLDGQAATGRAFLHSGLIFALLAGFLALATSRPITASAAQGLFPLLAAIYLFLPAAMAVPLAETLEMGFLDAWFEMVASFTTTGASLLDAPRRLPEAVHLWRGMAGWFGGLLVLVSATALLAPLGLGGFELIRPHAEATALHRDTGLSTGQRMRAHTLIILPFYLGLTALLWLVLVMLGVPGFSALMQAMATLSTSGILAQESLGRVGFAAELAIFAFLVLALSRGLMPGPSRGARQRLSPGPEMRVAALIVALVVLIVVLRHWLGAFEVAEGENLPAMGRAAWGATFTALSFLTTTGFVSEGWIASRAWSGLTPPGLVLMGLTIIGGGVATTAGGVKLLRVYALARLGKVELERMVFPSMVAGGGERLRFLTTRGGRAAWLFVMVFAITVALLIAALMLSGMSFETGLVFTIAALTTTGPLVQVAGDLPLQWALLSVPAKAVLALGMILGRLEILVMLALLMAKFGRD
ncbi:MAG: potassium transporter TrkG [Pararhodobacter sp.]